MDAQLSKAAPGTAPLDAQPDLPPVDERGATTFSSSVVAKIAAQSALEYRLIGASAGGVLGLRARRDFHSRPAVECDLYGTVAVLKMDVGVAFPAPLRKVCAGLRDHVRNRVEHLTGLQVGRIDVDVSWLNPEVGTRGALR